MLVDSQPMGEDRCRQITAVRAAAERERTKEMEKDKQQKQTVAQRSPQYIRGLNSESSAPVLKTRYRPTQLFNTLFLRKKKKKTDIV